MTIKEISKKDIEKISFKIFGDDIRTVSINEIRPIMQHNIWKVCGCNGNLSYIVKLKNDPQKYVFRFNKWDREDLYSKELENYKLIASKTGIPVPKIYVVDREKSIVPVSYMVMDFMPGEEAQFLSHPDNPDTNTQEKDEIQESLGKCYAKIHNITRRQKDSNKMKNKLIERLKQLLSVVNDGQYEIDNNKLRLCEEAINNDEYLSVPEESLCVGDAEIHFMKNRHKWNPSFICLSGVSPMRGVAFCPEK